MASVTIYWADQRGRDRDTYCQFEAENPPRVGEYLTEMPDGQGGTMRHFRVVAVRHGVRFQRLQTVELWVEEAGAVPSEVKLKGST